MIEKELKITFLTEEGFQLFVNSLGFPLSEKVFSNHFFDTEDFDLLSSGAALRLREYTEDNTLFMTLKCKGSCKDGVYSHLEFEEKVNIKILKQFYSGTSTWEHVVENLNITDYKKLLPALKVEQQLKYLGCFTSHRRKFKFPEGEACGCSYLELDHVSFSEKHELFELECEGENPDMLKSIIEESLNSHDVKWQHSESTKFGFFVKNSLNLNRS